MKSYFLVSVAVLLCCCEAPTKNNFDEQSAASVEERISEYIGYLPATKDSGKVNLLINIAELYGNRKSDSCIYYLTSANSYAKALGYADGVARSLMRLSEINYGFGNQKEAFKYSVEGLEAAKKSTDLLTLGYAYTLLGYSYSQENKNKQALVILDTAEKIYNGLPPEKLQSSKPFHYTSSNLSPSYRNVSYGTAVDKAKFLLLINKGRIYFNEKNLYEAVKHFRRVADLTEKVGATQGYADAMKLLGLIYYQLDEYRTALDYYNKAAALSKERTGIYGGPLDHDFGNCYLQLKMFDSALYYYKAGLDMIRELKGDEKFLQRLRMGTEVKLAETYTLMGKHDTALQILFPIFDYWAKAENSGRIIQTLPKIGMAYLGKRDYSNALLYSRQLVALSRQTNSRDGLGKGASLLTKIFDQTKRYDSAYYYSKIYAGIRDSVSKAEFKDHTTYLKALGQNDVNEANLLLLNSQNKVKQQKLNFLVAGLIAVILLGVILVRNLYLKRKNEHNKRNLLESELQIRRLENEKQAALFRQQASELEMQALRAQMNPHFIFNCLNAINHFVLKNDTQAASDYLTKFSRLIRQVLQNSLKKSISLADEISTLKLYIELEQVRFKNHFEYTITVDEDIDTDSILIPPLLLQPFVENAIWHGLMPKKEQGLLTIGVSLENNLLSCKVVDNGVGRQASPKPLSADTTKKKSLGMQITANRLKMLDDTLDDEVMMRVVDLKDEQNHNSGTKVVINIPVVFDDAKTPELV